MQELIARKRILWPAKLEGRPRLKRFLNDLKSTVTGFSSLQDLGYTTDGTREVEAIFGEKLFAFPKPLGVPRVAVEQCTSSDEAEIVLDFFAGSCTTAQALLELNREDGGNRRFVMVQLPEPTGNKQFPTIAEIGKERIRRVIAKLNKESGDLTRTTPEDLGFKVFGLGASHFEQWAGVPDRDARQFATTMEAFLDPLKSGADSVAVLWELAIKEGYGLNSTIAAANVGPNTIYTVIDPERDPPQSFRACLDEQLAPDIAKQLALNELDTFVCRDSALNDTLAANLALQCRLKTF